MTVGGAASNGATFTIVASVGTIAGKVTTVDGITGIDGATITIKQGATTVGTTTTNGLGDYSVPNIGPGSYNVQTLASGYDAQGRGGISVTSGATALANFSLSTAGISYVYDKLGRLVGAVDPAGDAVKYAYDAVGNHLSISRQASSQAEIINFSPESGPAGTQVTLYGTGFSGVVSDNAVSLNGIGATVISAAPTQIVVTVPSGATTGLIGVTTPTSSPKRKGPVAGSPRFSGLKLGKYSLYVEESISEGRRTLLNYIHWVTENSTLLTAHHSILYCR